MKKGFTLVELIGVIVILGVLAVFAVPALTKTFKKTANKESEEYIKNIILAAENYYHTNPDSENIINGCISISTLIEEGYLKNNINSITGTSISNDSTVIISKNNEGVEQYSIVEESITNIERCNQ